jgi:K+/H+ antiporter YhaU regulatory subunit KhtT
MALDLEIDEMHISSTSAFAGKTIESSRIRQERGVIVLAIKRREDMHFNPAPDERIEPDDGLIAMGEPAQLRQLELTATSKS